MSYAIIMPIYNNNQTIEIPFKNLNLILNEIKNKVTNNPEPYLIFIDDNSKENNHKTTYDYIMNNIDEQYKCNILYLRNKENIGVFQNINKALNILLGNDLIKAKYRINHVIIRDSDDYMTTENFNVIKEMKDNNYLAIPRVKLEVMQDEIKDFFLLIKNENNFDKIKKTENEYFNLKCNKFNNDRLFFGTNNTKMNENKQLLVNDVNAFNFEFYDLFYAYAMAGFNLEYFKIFGGYQISNIDASAKKANDITVIKILIHVITNMLVKNEFSINKENENYIKLMNIVNNIKIGNVIKQVKTYDKNNNIIINNGFDYPSIFRVNRENSLSSISIASKEYFYFQNLEKFIDLKKDLYKIIRNIKSFNTIANKSNIDSILEYTFKIAKYILEKFYTPIITTNCQEIVYLGTNWKIE